MDAIGQAAAVAGVLILLAAALHWLRKGGAAAWPVGAGRGGRRMQSLERLALSPQHSLHLVRVGERTLLVATSPSGCTVLESGPREAGEAGPR